ncbi:MAG TPA: hypothetical protein VIF62_16090 [Labilithrix sp.]
MRAVARHSTKLAGSLAIAGMCILHTSDANADVTSWLSAGGGYGFERNAPRNVYDRATAISFAVGVGSSPTSSLVVGGMFRTTTYLTLGSDIGLALRVASGGFARGQWGLAIDLGPKYRAFGGGDYARWPIDGMVFLGGPWGLQLGVGGDLFNIITPNDPGARGVTALLEIDFLRLTVMRQGATDRWWENPSPAGGHMIRTPQ